jgi:hypothetical protein
MQCENAMKCMPPLLTHAQSPSTVALLSFLFYLLYDIMIIDSKIKKYCDNCLANFFYTILLCLFLMVKKRQSSSRGANLGQSVNQNSNTSQWFKIVSDLHPPDSPHRFFFCLILIYHVKFLPPTLHFFFMFEI